MQDSYRQGLSDAREASKARIRKLEQRLAALEKVSEAAKLFCESTVAEMDALDGTDSASAPAEFMLLHEAVKAINAPAPESQPAGESPDPNPSKS